MRQAITTKYLGPTNSRGSRIKATAAAGSITIPYDYAGSSDICHANAAKALADKLDWAGLWVGGGLPSGDGNVYVCVGFPHLQPDVDVITKHFGHGGSDWFVTHEKRNTALDEDCAVGLHSWTGQSGKLPADTPCTRCGELYGDPE